MLDWLLGKIKWLLLVAAVGGPILAFISWQDEQRRHAVVANGVDATAEIEGLTRSKRRRGGTSYKVSLSWTDADGKARSATDVPLSNGYAERMIRNDKIVVDKLPIRYIAKSETEENVILAEDESWQEKSDRELIYAGAIAGLVGAIGWGLIFLLGRRRKTAQVA